LRHPFNSGLPPSPPSTTPSITDGVALAVPVLVEIPHSVAERVEVGEDFPFTEKTPPATAAGVPY